MKNNIIKVWKSRNQIYEGVMNRVFKKEHVEEIAEERKLICLDCEHWDITGKGCLVPGTQPCCDVCNCSMEFKLRALSDKCPLDKWNSIVSEDEEDIINEIL